MNRPRSRLGFLALGLLVVPFHGDLHDATAELRRLAPELEPRVAHHLVHDDATQFLAYARRTGLNEIKDAIMALDYGFSTESREAYRRTSQALFPYLERLAWALDVEYGCSEYTKEVAFREALGDGGLDLKLLRYGLDTLTLDAAMPLEAKRQGYARFAAIFERMGYERVLPAIDAALARDVMQTGDLAARGRYLRCAVEGARRLGQKLMMCQFLGELGDLHGREGDRDSMLLCYAEGIAIADRHRIPEQAARLRSFMASHYLEEGRLALAADLLRDARIYCRRFGGGPVEVRTVLRTMKVFADLGCWDIVRNEWTRLPVLLRALKRAGHHFDHSRYVLEAELWSARLMARSGAPAPAAEKMTNLLATMRPTHGREALAVVHRERAQALLDAGDVARTRQAIGEGLAYADSFHTPYEAAELATLGVRAELAAHDLDAATSRLLHARRRCAEAGHTGSASPASLALLACTLDALAARIALARGDRAEALRIVERALASLRAHLAEQDATPHAYLIAGRIDDLRLVAHDALGEDPAQSLDMELSWRSLGSRLGVRTRDLPVSTGRPGSAAELRLVYVATPAGVIRWTKLGATIRRELLPCTFAESERLVDRFMRMVASDPHDPETSSPAELQELAARLGECLLPVELRDAGRRRVIVSAEGPLARLPFEALDLPGPGYVPLLALHDVAYARPVAPRIPRRGNGASVFLIGALDEEADPAIAELRAVESEIAAARQRLPAGPTLRSTATSKRGVLQSFAAASMVYVAAHQVRDPQAPLFAYFPMSFGIRATNPEDRYLDLGDLRGVDFGGCELAVLSSCASGEPYVVQGRSGPSMADVILDAGARAVIHTRWRVRDEVAAKVAPTLAASWAGARSRVEAIRAWSAARRKAIHGPRGVRHPFGWAAWSATLAEPVEPWPLETLGVTKSRIPDEVSGIVRPPVLGAPSSRQPPSSMVAPQSR